LIEPRLRDLHIHSRDLDQLIRIENSKTPVLKLNDSLLPQGTEDTVDMNECQARRIADLFLS